MGLLVKFVIEKGLDYLFSKGLDKICDKLAPNPINSAYEKALNRWCRNDEIREKYAIFRFSHFEEFRKYIIGGPAICNSELVSLCELFEEELKKDDAYHYIEDIRLQAIQEGQKEIQGEIEEISSGINELSTQSQKQELLLEKIYNCVSEVRKIESTLPDAVPSIDDDYIPRKCSCAYDEKNYLDKYFHPEKYPEYSLIDFVLGRAKSNNHFLLCGDAQSGKTTELRHLFHELVDSGLFRLFYQEIKGWDFDLADLSETEQHETFMIIDALDERFDDEERNKLFNRVNIFGKRNPFLKIVLSCRSNFKEINQLDGFEKLYLLDLKWEESKEIIRVKSYNAEALVSEIEAKKLYELTQTPLFLLTIIECFQEKNHIPDNKSELYDYIINRQLEKEEAKGIAAHSRMVKEGRAALESMAVGLQLMDKNAFSEDELLDLFDDEKQWTRIQRCGLIERENSNYSFVHNAFKEYLTSVFLDRIKSLDEIQKLCCFNGTKAIKPTWYNVIVIYLSRLSKENTLFNEIIEWLEKDNEDLLLYVDRRLLDEDKRCAIFISILNECEKKGVIYGVRNESLVEALMSFGYGKDSINYIIGELEKVTEYNTHVSNLLRCLQFIYWPTLVSENFQNASKLKTLIFELFKRFCGDKNAWAIWEPFENSYLFGKDTLDNLLSNIINSKHPRIWDSFIRLVYKANIADYYIDIIIEKSEFVHDYDDNGVTCAILPIWVNESFKSVTTSEGILKILSYFERGVRDRASRNEFVVNHKGVIEVLISNGERVIPKTELTTVLKKVFESGIDPISSYGETHDINKPIVDYLTRQGLAESLFEEYTEKIVSGFENKVQDLSPHKYSKCAAYFVSGERFELFASQYPNTEVGFLSVRCLNSYISNRDYNYTQIIKEYYPLYYADVDTQIRNQKTYYLNCLFDYESFKNEVMRLLYEYPDNRQALRKRLDEYDDIEDRLNIYVYYFFNEFVQKDGYDFEAIEKNINDKDFYQMFLLKETVNMLSTENDIILTDAQVQVLVQIAKEFIHRFANEDERLTIHHLYHPIEMILRGYVDIDDSCLLKLLPYSTYYIYDSNRMNYYSLFEYISGRPGIDKQVIMDYIVSEVKSGRSITEFEHIKWAGFIIHNNIENGFHYVIDWAKNDEYDSILPMLADNPRTLQIVTSENVYNQFPLRVRLSLFEILVRKEGYDASWVKYQLELLFDSLDEETDRFSAMRMLLMLGSIKGLEYLNMHPEYFSKKRLIMDYDCVESLPLLFDSLDWLMEERDGYEGVVLYETKTSVFTSIGKIAAHSQTMFDEVENRINKLVESNKAKYSELNYHLSEWKENLYKKNTQIWTIERVREVLLVYKLVG